MRIDCITSSDGDWEGLYVNGKLIAEDHSLDSRTVIEALGFVATYREVDATWLNERGHLPAGVDELPQ